MSSKKRSVCPVACTLDLVGDKWTLLVVRDLACGKRTFGEFARSPEGIATNILTDRLEKLVANGLVEAFTTTDTGRVAYRLTSKGRTLGPIIASIAVWGLAHIKGTQARLTPVFE